MHKVTVVTVFWIKNTNTNFKSDIPLPKQDKSQNGYVTNISSELRHQILIMIIRVAISTNIKIATASARVVGSFSTLSVLEQLCGCSGH
jgi:hypothetical protein